MLAACGGLPLTVDDSVPQHPVAVPTIEQPAVEALVAIDLPASAERLAIIVAERPVAVLVSSSLPAYEQVAARLRDLIGHDKVLLHVLDSEAADPDNVVAAFNGAAPRATVAIGLEAALIASGSLVSPVIFCQVFNYSEHERLLEASAAVSVLPSFAGQLRIWQQLDSSLESIGAIVGPGHEDLIADSQRAAVAAGVRFDHRVSSSDQETIYLFKRLAVEVDGFWLVPDNRILSVNAIREILSYATQHRVQVVVSSPELLDLGALMSMTPTPAQVAETVYGLLRDIDKPSEADLRIVAPLQFDVKINASTAYRFGLDLAEYETSVVRAQ